MLALRCALLTALLAAPGAALAPWGCPAPGKGTGRTWRAGEGGGGAPSRGCWRSPRAPRPPDTRAPPPSCAFGLESA